MHGKILKHTHYFRAASERIMDFKWDMEVENGNAKYEKIGNYYYVCHTDTINVFYDTPPTNLVFWRIMDFKWDMEVENGNAKYEKIGNYYYVCHTDTINVFYDTPPTNLVFWPRSEI